MNQKPAVPFAAVLLLCALLCFSISLNRLEQDRRSEGKQQLEQTLRRTAAACYAAEGFYPPNVAYMEEHYGLRYDSREYIIHYGIFASNLMPDITVLEK